MVVFLLIIIACVLLFGKEETQGCLKYILGVLVIFFIIAAIFSSCS